MRALRRNKSEFYFAPYAGRVPMTDDYGNLTGEYEILYGNPVKCSANISAAKGETQTRQFGENESYDKILVMDNTAPEIDEYAILWVDTVPVLNADGSLAKDNDDKDTTPHDYVVKKVAKSLNSVSVAISKVIVQ